MDKYENTLVDIKYDRWKRIILITQLVLAGLILLTEIVGNIMLYVTRSQGYGPDTIVEKLMRYLVLTTFLNVVAILFGQIISNKYNNTSIQKYVLIITTEIICTNVAFSHYQFTNTFALFAIPIILSILYEDIKLSRCALIIGMCGMTIAIISRGLDSAYNTDIGPEAAISYVFLLSVYLFSKICLTTLTERRAELKSALEHAEKIKYLEQVQNMSIQMLETLANTLDAKDKYTNGHSYRVSMYSMLLARKIGMDDDEIEMLRQEALLHDIGKIGVPDSVLNNPGKLTDIEFKIMKSHTTVGAQILENLLSIPNAAAVAGGHHERYDGKGYPKGLKGDEIHIHARIVGIADAYDAMSSDRIYRKALPKEKIREQLLVGSGGQFDPELLGAFLKMFDAGELDLNNQPAFVRESDDEIETIRENLSSFITGMSKANMRNGATEIAYYSFKDIYGFIEQLRRRYDHTFELVMVTVEPIEPELISDDELDRSFRAMEMAIKKNVRTVDIYTKYSKMQHLLTLTNAGNDNIDMIIQRIFLDYYKLYDTNKFILTYEIGENRWKK